MAFHTLPVSIWVLLPACALAAIAGGIPLVAHHVELMAMALASVGIVSILVRAARRRRSAPPADARSTEVRELAGV